MPHPAPLPTMPTAEMVTVPQLCFHTRGNRFPIGMARLLQVVVDVFLYPAVHWSMQTRQFANIKRLAERDWGASIHKTVSWGRGR